MKSTRFPGKVIVDELVVREKLEAKEASLAENGTELTGVMVKTTVPTASDKLPVGTLWVKTDASSPKVYICVANGTTATWKELTLATS
nr:MAG TPA: hypothetical protein [Bacteriophage sp.]